jgi:plastocyanin
MIPPGRGPTRYALTPMARALIVLALFLTACAEETAAPPASESPTPEATFAPSEQTPSPEPPANVECVDATATGRPEVTIRLVDDEYVPACLSVLGGQGIKLTNRGGSVHNFSVEGSDVDIDIPPGETIPTEAIAGAVEPGTHTFFCEYHRSRGMEGQITISEAG